MSALSENFRVTTDITNPTCEGTFEEAQQIQKETEQTTQQFKYLGTICEVCKEAFLPKAEITIFSCWHGFHSHCIQQKKCPFDGTFEIKFLKINCFALSLILQLGYFTSGLDEWLADRQSEINSALDEYIESEKKINPAQMQRLLADLKREKDGSGVRFFILSVIRDCLNIYIGMLPPSVIGLRAMHITDLMTVGLSGEITNQKNLDAVDLDLELLGRVFDVLPILVSYLNSVSDAFEVEEIKISHINLFLHSLHEKLTSFLSKFKNSSNYFKITKNRDHYFFTYHFEKLHLLASQKERYSYLSKLNDVSLIRFNQLNLGKKKIYTELRTSVKRISSERLIEAELFRNLKWTVLAFFIALVFQLVIVPKKV